MESKDDESADSKTSGIQVFLRIRPSRAPSNFIKRDDVDVNKICFQVPKQEDVIVNNSKSSYGFKFNGILDEKANQRDVFKTIGIPVLKNSLAGYNSTIFAYGQTGSGKTFTITGGPERYEDRGIIPRTISQLFKTINSASNGITYNCYVSYLEIYNQSGYDLLTDTISSFDDIPKVTMLEDEFGYFHFKNLSVHSAKTEEEALNLLFQGDTNRAVAATEMNQNSTRSHCIFTLILECRNAGADTVTRSKLNIVDLAGSERVSRTSSEGQTLKEAKYINSSLFFLEMVIVALHEKNKRANVHIPYRNSMMTSVLRDSLGGNCKTVMIATISPEAQHTDESISTCHFAQRVALVKNEASINEEIEPEMVIRRLQAEVKRLRDEVAFLQGKSDDSDDEDESDQLPQHELNELTEAVTKYVEDSNDHAQLSFCGGITLPKIKAICSIFKKMLRSNERFGRQGVRSNNRSDSVSDSIDDDSVSATKSDNNTRKQHGNVVHQSFEKDNQQTQKKPESKPKTKMVCGVPFCSDQQVLDDPNVSFTWFKDRYPGLSSLEKAKDSLKAKYTKAKDGGKKIEEIRSEITYHKDAIERLRRNHAIDMISQTGEYSEDDLSSQENFHSDAIDKQKKSYSETIEYLRKLKSTIEHQQKTVEKARAKMQSDFDAWYREMCSQDFSRQQSIVPVREHEAIAKRKLLEKASIADSNTVNRQLQLHAEETKAEESVFVLPPGIKLTGNKEADEDIIAFFKAKQVLLSRTNKK